MDASTEERNAKTGRGKSLLREEADLKLWILNHDLDLEAVLSRQHGHGALTDLVIRDSRRRHERHSRLMNDEQGMQDAIEIALRKLRRG